MTKTKPYGNVRKPWRQADGPFTNFQIRDEADGLVCEVFGGDDVDNLLPRKVFDDNFRLILDAPDILTHRDELLKVLSTRGCESAFARGCFVEIEAGHYGEFDPCDTCKVLKKI